MIIQQNVNINKMRIVFFVLFFLSCYDAIIVTRSLRFFIVLMALVTFVFVHEEEADTKLYLEASLNFTREI